MKQISLTFLLMLLASMLYAQNPSKINLSIEELRSTDGFILIEVIDENDNTIKQIKEAIVDNILSISISDIIPGTYGIRICHDEDGSNDMTLNWLGIPKEGFGYSWDRKVVMKEPDFEDYAFTVEEENETEVKIKLQYL